MESEESYSIPNKPNAYCTLKRNLVEMIKNELILQGANVDTWCAYKVIIRCRICKHHAILFYNIDDKLVDKYSEIKSNCVNYDHEYDRYYGVFLGDVWHEAETGDNTNISLFYAKLYSFIKSKGEITPNLFTNVM